MRIDETLKEVLTKSPIKKDDQYRKLEEAAKQYKSMIEANVITPRGNQLIKDNVMYQKSNIVLW